MKNIILFGAFVFFLSSCEKNIDFNLKYAEPVLVVDAQIENGQAPTVVLSKSLDYFSKISEQILSNSFVHNAEVTMSNGIVTNHLKEYTILLNGGYTGYYYGIDYSNPATAFTGEFNKQYTLSIKVDSKEYTSVTNIPLLKKYPDSLWFKVAPQNPDPLKRVLIARVTDPPGLGDYVRYFTKKNGGFFLPGLNSVYNDQFVDGTTYEGQVDPGVDRNNPISYDDNMFKKGDTVTFKLSSIDKATYTFWNTWEFSQQSIGNPFSQPGKVVGNISNGALGAFCGYASWYGTIIAN